MSQTDLKLRRTSDGRYDLDVAQRDLCTIHGADLLVQALTLRLVTMRGELGLLGHARYGSQVHTLIGQTRDRENLGLLRRYVRKALLGDPRVKDVSRIDLDCRDPATIEVYATVVPHQGPALTLRVNVDA